MKFINHKMLPVIFAGSIFFQLQVAAQPWTIFNTAGSPIPQNTVRCLAVDSQNRKWVGTDLGLAIYNDTNWTIYTTASTLGGLTDNSIRSITFDAAGNAWLGTFNGGACRFDGTSWISYHVSNSGMPDDFVKGIAFDTSGTPWFATAGGLAHYDGIAWQVWNIGNSPLLSHNIACITIGSNNMKYLGTLNGGMVYFDGDTSWQFFNHVNLLLPDNTALAIALDSNGTRWVALPAQGLYAHPDSGPPGWWYIGNSAIPTSAIVHVMVDAAQKKYMGSQDEGFIIYNGTSFVNYKMSNSPMPDDYVLCTVKDHSGILWVGTYNGGLVRVDEALINSTDEQAQEVFSVALYPNPARDVLTVAGNMTSTKTEIEIYNIGGQHLYQQQTTNKSQTTLDISSLAPGIYFLRIISEQGIITRKFVKAD